MVKAGQCPNKLNQSSPCLSLIWSIHSVQKVHKVCNCLVLMKLDVKGNMYVIREDESSNIESIFNDQN